MRAAFFPTLAAACALLAPLAAAQPLPVEGAYGSLISCEDHARGEAAAIVGDNDRLFLLTDEMITGHEWACTVREAAQIGSGIWRAELDCAGEGTEWPETAMITLDPAAGFASVAFISGWGISGDLCSLPYPERAQREARRLSE